MKKIINIENFFLILWGLYYTQGVFIPQGSIISRAILVVYLLISLYCMVKVNQYVRLRSKYVRALNFLVLMLSVYCLITIIINQGEGDQLKAIYLSLLPTYTFYYFIQKKQISENWYRWVLIYCAAIFGVQYMVYYNAMQEYLLEAEEGFTINVAYQFVALLPLLWFWREKPMLQYVFLFFVLLVVLSTAKRGAILISFLCMLYYVSQSLRNRAPSQKFGYFMLVVLFLFVLLHFSENYYLNNAYLQDRWEGTQEGNSSGRNYIYPKYWNVFVNSDSWEFLFGHGMGWGRGHIGQSAHNDWLQFLVDYGLFGTVVYLYYWIVFIRTGTKDHDNKTRPIICSVIIIYFMATLFSMSYNAIELPASICLGYSLSEQKNRRTKLMSG